MFGSKKVANIPALNIIAPITIIFLFLFGFLDNILPITYDNTAAIPYGINKKYPAVT
jgi:hypothetical protein